MSRGMALVLLLGTYVAEALAYVFGIHGWAS